MIQKLLIIFAFGLTGVLCSYGGHDLFTSLSQLHSLWRNEQAFVNKMEEALTNMETMVTAMKRYVKSYKQIELDKNAEEFKRHHEERHKLFQQWQEVTENISKRD